MKSLTLLFTDLKGSTEMYERIGDLRAFDLVRQHFGVLQEIIATRGGAMVKTIGDAIMASFPEAEPALEAAIAMNRDIQKVGKPGEMQLKIGMHTGPCIAVEQNERLDYFGQTVNIAARVQNVAAANEIAITDPILAAPRSRDILRAMKVHTTKESLKGVDGLVTVHHVT
jgi:class 3 adenylate cyclase